MKNYTVIYNQVNQLPRYTITKSKRFSASHPKKIIDYFEQNNEGYIVFIFEGFSLFLGENVIDEKNVLKLD